MGPGLRPYTAPIARRTPNCLRRLSATLLGTLAVLVPGGSLAGPVTSAVAEGTAVGSLVRAEAHAPGNGMTSTNWAGYQATARKGTFTDVQASWRVPTVVCGSPATNASIWVGLGTGTGTSPLFQTGVALNCQSGSPQFLAWWEEFPVNLEQDYADPVSAGDLIHADVTHQGGMEVLTVSDTSPSSQPLWSESTTIQGTGPSVTAECIVERPTVGTMLATLTNFGKESVAGCQDTEATPSATVTNPLPNGPVPAKTTVKSITMVGSAANVLVSVKTTKAAHNGNFTATWHASS